MHVHSDRLERWLGADVVARLSSHMRGWYGPHIALAGVPGAVYVTRDGDFVGKLDAGAEMSKHDRLADMVSRERRRRLAAMARGRKQLGAFGSLDAIVAAATAAKYQRLWMQKTGTAASVLGAAMDLYHTAGFPAAGPAAAAAPGGAVYTSNSGGVIPFTNPATANSLQPVSGWGMASVANNTLLLCDRLGAIAKTMNSVAAENSTNAPTRYQGTVSGAVASGDGSFVYPMVPTTVLPATAHNWTVVYTNSGGVAVHSTQVSAGLASCAVNGVDLAVGAWFMALQAGDLGVQKITSMTCSALVATGTIEFVHAHPLVFLPCPIAQLVCKADFLYNAFEAVKIIDSAALYCMEMPKPAVTATTYGAQVYAVAE